MNTLKVFPPQSKTDITVVTVTKDRTEEDEKKFIRSVAEAIFRGQQHVSSFEGAGLQFMVFEGLSPEQGEIICQTAPKFPNPTEESGKSNEQEKKRYSFKEIGSIEKKLHYLFPWFDQYVELQDNYRATRFSDERKHATTLTVIHGKEEILKVKCWDHPIPEYEFESTRFKTIQEAEQFVGTLKRKESEPQTDNSEKVIEVGVKEEKPTLAQLLKETREKAIERFGNNYVEVNREMDEAVSNHFGIHVKGDYTYSEHGWMRVVERAKEIKLTAKKAFSMGLAYMANGGTPGALDSSFENWWKTCVLNLPETTQEG